MQNLLEAAKLTFKQLKKFSNNRIPTETRIVIDEMNSDGKPLFVMVPYDEYISLQRKSEEHGTLMEAYREILKELFPTNVDGFNRGVDHERILREVRSLRVVHSANVKLNLLMGRAKFDIRQIQTYINRIMKEFEEF